MKKGTIIALVLAFVMIFAGIVMLILGLSFSGENPPKSALIQQEVLIQESFENIQIDTADCDVTFVPYNGTANAHVVIMEREDTPHSVTVEDGTLKINMTDNRQWTDYIGVHWETMEMTVYLPETEYQFLYIATDTGEIRTPAPLCAKEILLRSGTGEIYCDSAAGELLDCMTSTGDISVRGGRPAEIKLCSSTGEIYLQDAAGGEIHLSNSTGETDLENVTAQRITCSSSAGDVELEQVLADDYLQIRTDTGDVGVENCDAGRVDIETNTGDVSGNFLTPKWFSVHSDTGNVTVPDTREGGECRIQTDSGDIHFK